MKTTLHIEIPEAVLIGDIERLTDEQWTKLVKDHYQTHVNRVVTKAKNTVHGAQIENLLRNTRDEFEDSLKLLAEAEAAYEALQADWHVKTEKE